MTYGLTLERFGCWTPFVEIIIIITIIIKSTFLIKVKLTKSSFEIGGVETLIK